MADPRILIVDDDPIVREVLGLYLARKGFGVDTAHDGPSAIASFNRTQPDLVVLDLMLPEIDGFEVFRRIRSHSSTPVIMLTAKGQETDRIAGLETGADDYVAKPFSPREVAARVDAVLRRTDAPPGEKDGSMSFGELTIDGESREARVAGRIVELTPKEFDLMHFMALHPRTVFSRVDLLEEIWDFAFEGDPSTVTVHIRRLREKIEDDPSHPRHFVTVWGAGYRFDP